MYIMLLNATLPLTFWNSDTIETSSCEQTEDLEVHRILQKVLPVKVSGPRLCNESLAVWGFFLHWQTNADVHATSILNLDQWYNMQCLKIIRVLLHLNSLNCSTLNHSGHTRGNRHYVEQIVCIICIYTQQNSVGVYCICLHDQWHVAILTQPLALLYPLAMYKTIKASHINN